MAEILGRPLGAAASLLGRSIAHTEDSLAVAEHLAAEELWRRASTMRASTPHQLLTRAGFYYEHALATPGTEGDEESFGLARADLTRIVEDDKLSYRSLTLVNAKLMLAYEGIFRMRASSKPAPERTYITLRNQIGQIADDFLYGSGRDEALSDQDHGTLSELMAAYYPLNGYLLPYIALHREESNMISWDNHDYYTLHPCRRNRIKKVPISVKFREPGEGSVVVKLAMGIMALRVANKVPGYAGKLGSGKEGHAAALRLATDIAICHAADEPLSPEDSAFSAALTKATVKRIRRFAATAPPVDYASNAEAIRAEIMARGAARHLS